jgi:hypothetical protein
LGGPVRIVRFDQREEGGREERAFLGQSKDVISLRVSVFGEMSSFPNRLEELLCGLSPELPQHEQRRGGKG